MKKFLEAKYEIVFLLVIVSISSLISLADFFGLLNAIPWLSSHIPTITLLFVALALGSLSIAQIKHTEEQFALKEEMGLVLSGELKALMGKSLEQVDANFKKIFESHLKQIAKDFESFVKNHTITFETLNEQAYTVYYRSTLEEYPRATFLGTSWPDSFLWKDPHHRALDDNDRFINQQHGHIKRIFFVESKDLDSKHFRMLLARHFGIGIEVYTVMDVPEPRRRYILVDGKGRIAWQSEFDDRSKLRSAEATTKAKANEYLTFFNELYANRAKKYSPAVKEIKEYFEYFRTVYQDEKDWEQFKKDVLGSSVDDQQLSGEQLRMLARKIWQEEHEHAQVKV